MTPPTRSRICFDANAIILAFEGRGTVADAIRCVLDAVSLGWIAGVTSEITWSEVLVVPKAKGDAALVRFYEHFLTAPVLDVRPITRSILVQAAEIRSRSRAKLPDAIHAATAQDADCDIVLTFDDRFPLPSGAARIGPDEQAILALIPST